MPRTGSANKTSSNPWKMRKAWDACRASSSGVSPCFAVIMLHQCSAASVAASVPETLVGELAFGNFQATWRLPWARAEASLERRAFTIAHANAPLVSADATRTKILLDRSPYTILRKNGPSRSSVAPLIGGQPSSAWLRLGFGSIWTELGQTWPMPSMIAPISAKLGPNLGASFDPLWADVGELAADVGQSWSDLGQIGPISARLLGPMLAPDLGRFPPDLADVGQMWSIST